MKFLCGLILLLLLMLFGLFGRVTETEAAEGEKIDYILLRDVICSMETQGIKKPDFAVGLITKQTGGLPWGRCQLKYWTAINAGFSLNRNPGDLFLEEVNREFALRIILKCAKDLKRKGIVRTIKSLAHCYGSGRKSWNPNSNYAKTIQALYSQARFHDMFREMSQIEKWLLDQVEEERISQLDKERRISFFNKLKIFFVLFLKGEEKEESNSLDLWNAR